MRHADPDNEKVKQPKPLSTEWMYMDVDVEETNIVVEGLMFLTVATVWVVVYTYMLCSDIYDRVSRWFHGKIHGN